MTHKACSLLLAGVLVSTIGLYSGCEDSGPEQLVGSSTASPSSAPLTGKADGMDLADRDCGIVLREAYRPRADAGYEHDCSTGYCWFVWRGHLDVSLDALRDGAVPHVLYRVSGQGPWWEVEATATSPAAEGPFQRFEFRLAENTLPTGMSMTGLSRAHIELIPFIRIDGLRHFDHNRHSEDLQNYLLDSTNGWSVSDDPRVCREGAEPSAFIELKLGWTEERHGALVSGGLVHIDYDIGRLPECRGTHNGFPTWDVVAHALFQPGGHLVSTSVRAYDNHRGTPLPTGHSVRATLRLPREAETMEIWFENSNGVGDGCTSWDSNLGQNYRFEVLSSSPSPVGWAGDLGNGFNRQCVRVPGVSEPMSIGDWELQRACLFIDVDVWVPDLTSSDGRATDILAEVEYRADDQEPMRAWLRFVERSGNNYRYRWELPREWLIRNEWSQISWHFRFSTDNVSWYYLGLDDDAPRTFVNTR